MKLRVPGHHRLPPVRWGRIAPALIVLAVAAGVAAVLLNRPGSEAAGGGGRGQIAGTVATATAETREIAATIRLAGSVAATDSADVLAGLAGRIDDVRVKLGDEVIAGETIAHVSQPKSEDTEAVFHETLADTAAVSCSSPSAPTASPTTPAPTPSPSPTATPTSSPTRTQQPSSRPTKTPATGGVQIPAPKITIQPRITIQPKITMPDITLPSGPTEQTLTAPFDGRVTKLEVVDGSSVSASTVVATVSGHGLEVRADAPPAEATQLTNKTGARATVRPAVPGSSTEIAARMSSLAPAAEAASGQTPVVLTFTADATALKPGDPVSADILLPTGKGVVVPADAVVYPDGNASVFVIDNQIDPQALGLQLPANLPPGIKIGRVTATPVQLGVRAGDDQQVTGVDAGAVVVASGQSSLVDGARVAILDTATPTPSATGTR